MLTVDLAPFEDIRFGDRAEAETRLTTILNGTNGLLAENLLTAFSEVGDAARVLLRLERFLDNDEARWDVAHSGRRQLGSRSPYAMRCTSLQSRGEPR